MSLLDKFLKKKNNDKKVEQSQVEITREGNNINIGGVARISFSGGYVGSSTGGQHSDYYVYEWFIKDTGEVFYVGKGRGDRYKEYHEKAYEAEKIRKAYDVGIRFVAQDLTEEQALEIETQEMTRILNETNDRLTNRIIPFFTKRDNGYSKSPNTPPYEFETAPVLYACEIDEHYFGIKGRPFDSVEVESLSRPAFIEKGVSSEEISIIYGKQYEKYYNA